MPGKSSVWRVTEESDTFATPLVGEQTSRTLTHWTFMESLPLPRTGPLPTRKTWSLWSKANSQSLTQTRTRNLQGTDYSSTIVENMIGHEPSPDSRGNQRVLQLRHCHTRGRGARRQGRIRLSTTMPRLGRRNQD